MDTDHAQRESVNAPGWKWNPKQRVHLWWNGERYAWRADWDGAQWQVSQIRVGANKVRTPRELLFIACWFVVLTGIGFLTLSAGGLLRSESGAECDLDRQFDAGWFGLLWLIGIVVAAVGAVTLIRRLGARIEALMLVLGAAVLPVLMLVGAAMNCSNY